MKRFISLLLILLVIFLPVAHLSEEGNHNDVEIFSLESKVCVHRLGADEFFRCLSEFFLLRMTMNPHVVYEFLNFGALH